MAINYDAMFDSSGRPLPPPDLYGMQRRGAVPFIPPQPVANAPAAPVSVDAGNTMPTAATDAGFDAQAMQRRLTQPQETFDPGAPGGDQGDFSRGVELGVSELGTGLKNLKGIGQAFLGDEEGATKTFKESQAEQQFAQRRGPSVQDINQVIQDPSKAGDYASGFLGSAIPTMASMLIPGGLEGKAAESMARRGVEKAAGRYADKVVEKALAKGTVDSVEDATALASRAKQFATTKGEAAVDIAKETGHVAGSSQGALPSTVASSTDALNDPDSPDSVKTRAGKVLAGDTIASVIGALPAARLLSRTGVAAEAGNAIAQETKAFIPRVTKEMATQAGVQGTLGVAQTAAVLATHKWVNNNIDLMSPDAIKQYVNAFAGGAIMGAATGGAFEALKGSGAQSADLRARLQKTVEDYRKANGEKPESGVGKPMADDAFNMDAEMGKHFDPAKHDADIDAHLQGIEDLHQQFQNGADPIVGEAPRKTNPVQFEDRTKNALGAFIPTDHPVWGLPDELNPVLDAATKALKGETLSTPEKRRLFQYGKLAGDPELPIKLLSAGPEWGAKLAQVKDLDASTHVEPSPAEKLGTHSEVDPDAPPTFDENGQPVDTTHDFMPGVNEHAKLPTAELSDRLVAATPGTDEHASLQAELRDRMIGRRLEPGSDAHTQKLNEIRSRASDPRFIKDNLEVRGGEGANNVIVANSDAQAETTLKRGFELDEKQGGKRVIVDIQNLVKKKLADKPGDAIGALSEVLGDMKLAGVDIKPESIKAGVEFAPDRKLTPNEAKSMRVATKLKPVTETGPRDQSREQNIGRTLAEIQRKAANKEGTKLAEETHEGQDTKEDGITERNETTKTVAGDFDEGADRAQGTKSLPPTDKGGGVASVDIVQPHEKTVAAFLRDRKGASNAAQLFGIRHEAGVKVGTAELTKMHEQGNISDRRFANQMARLKDADTGLSRSYLKRAMEGEFDSSRVTEAKADDPKSKSGEERNQTANTLEKATRALMWERVRADESLTHRERAQKLTDLNERKLSKADSEALVDNIDGKLPSRRTKLERMFLAAARDAEKTEGAREASMAEPTPELTPEQAKAAKDAADAREKVTTEAKPEPKPLNARSPDNQKRELGREALRKEAAEQLRQDTRRPDSDKRPGEEGDRAHTKSKEQLQQEARDAAHVKEMEEHQYDDLTEEPLKHDNEIDAGLRSAAGKDIAEHDVGKESKLVNAILKRVGLVGGLKVEHIRPHHLGVTGKLSAGIYDPTSKTIYLNPELHGLKRIEVLAHEIGHHIIRETIGADLEKASPELRKALDADYQKWLGENFRSDRTVAEILSSKKPANRAAAIEANGDLTTLGDLVERHGDAAMDYLFDREEWMADHIARALTTNKESVDEIHGFFANVAAKLKTAYESLFGTKSRAKYAPAESIDKWVQSLFDETTQSARRALDRPVDAEEAKTLHTVAQGASQATGTAPHGTAGSGHAPPPSGGAHGPSGGPGGASAPDFKAWQQFFRYTMSADERRIWRKALDRRVIETQLRKAFAHDPDLVGELDRTDARYDALSYMAYKEWAAGRMKLGPRATEVGMGVQTVLRKMAGVAGNNEFAERLFADYQNGKLAAIKAAGNTYDVRKSFEQPGKVAQQSYNIGRQIAFDNIYTPLRKAFWDVSDKLHSSDTPALTKIGALMKLHGGEGGKDGEVGILNDLHIKRQLFINKAADAVAGLEPKDLTDMHRILTERREILKPSTPAEHAAVKMRAVFKKAFDYGKEAGIPFHELDDYFPVVMDGAEVRNREGDFKRLLSNPKFEPAIRELFGSKGKPSTDPHDELIQKLVESAANDSPASKLGETQMAFKAKNPRLMDFIYKYGSEADKKSFTDFQAKDPEQVIRPYFDQLTRTAEWSRRFGHDDKGFNDLIAEAKKQGADESDINTAQLYAKVMKGTYASDGSPVLQGLLGKNLAGKIANKKTKLAFEYLMAYQNARTLPLTLLSSLADPMGIFVRTGGDFGAAWSGFKNGMRANMKSTNGDAQHLRDLYHTIGQADDYMTTEMLSNGYGSDQFSTLPRKISDTVFKWNGLTWFTKGTRYMALSAGENFLLKHGDGKNATSMRYLNELGLKPGDVQTQSINGKTTPKIRVLSDVERDNASKAELARDDRVRSGLNRFVDEAILRTDASQRPIWFNDPYMGLVTQYKSFAYAFDAQIISRIKHEVHYSNFKVLAPAAAYFPITMMGEFLRAGVQYGPGGNPNQQDWGPGEYAAFISRRTGLLGPRIQLGLDQFESHQYSNMGRMLELGPTVEQAGDFLEVAEGHRDLGKQLLDAAPASALYKHWSL